MKEFEAGKLELPGRPEEEELLRVIARKSMQQARSPQSCAVSKHESPARVCRKRDSFKLKSTQH
jgi:hypothetical protein